MRVQKLLAGLILALCLGVEGKSPKTFVGFKVYRAQLVSEDDVSFIKNLEKSPFVNFWSDIIPGRHVDVMVDPENQDEMETDFEKHGISYHILVSDVQARIELEKRTAPGGEETHTNHSMTWTDYHNLADIYDFLDYLEAAYDFVSTESIGKTTEGREMRVAKICKGVCGNKPGVWIDAGIHAREWIAPAAVTWMLNELVENDESHPDLTEEYDWYFLPAHNPDGYEFSWDEDRMWRKSRSDHGSEVGCLGVDLNRNWGFHYDEGGSSYDLCSPAYHGPEAYSEPENVNVRDFVLARKNEIVFFNTVHSFGQLILLPWGYTSHELPEDYDQMLELATMGQEALMDVNGEFYNVGCTPCILYKASGISIDWAHGEAGIEFVVSMELRDLEGFILPSDQIIPTAEEVWAFHTTVLREMSARRK